MRSRHQSTIVSAVPGKNPDPNDESPNQQDRRIQKSFQSQSCRNARAGQLDHDFSDTFRLVNSFRVGSTFRDSIVTTPRFVDIDPGTPGNQYGTLIRRTDWKDRYQTDTIIADQVNLSGEFATGPVRHAMSGGIDLAHEIQKRKRKDDFGALDSQDTDVFNPDPTDPYLDGIDFDGRRNHAKSDSVAFYAFDTMKFAEKWQLNAGLRVDYSHLEYDGLERTDTVPSWRSGLVYKPTKDGSIYFGAGTSFNPSSENFTLSTGATSSSNLNTDPEILGDHLGSPRCRQTTGGDPSGMFEGWIRSRGEETGYLNILCFACPPLRM